MKMLRTNQPGGASRLKNCCMIYYYSAESVTAAAEMTDDISEVFPYLNSIMKGTIFDHKNKTLNFKIEGHGITLYPRKIIVTNLQDIKDAEKVLKHLKILINRTYERREKIEPSYKTRAKLNVLGIYKHLPKQNCGECGEPACMGFAAKLISEETTIEKCNPLFTEEYKKEYQEIMKFLDEAGYLIPETQDE